MSPSGTFVGLSLSELQAELVIARNRVRNGDRVSLSGAGKSSGKSYSMSAADHVREVNYAIKLLTGTGLPSRTFFDVSRVR